MVRLELMGSWCITLIRNHILMTQGKYSFCYDCLHLCTDAWEAEEEAYLSFLVEVVWSFSVETDGRKQFKNDS